MNVRSEFRFGRKTCRVVALPGHGLCGRPLSVVHVPPRAGQYPTGGGRHHFVPKMMKLRESSSDRSNLLMAPTVLIPVAIGGEELEAISVVNVLRRAGCDVTMAAVSESKTVEGAHQIKIECDTLFKDVVGKEYDFIVVVGGLPGAENLAETKELIQMYKDQKARGKWYGAMCASPALVLKPNGLFPEAGTCYPSFQDKIKGAKHISDRVVVDEAAKVITSQGPGTACEFGLAIAKLLCGEKTSTAVKDYMLINA